MELNDLELTRVAERFGADKSRCEANVEDLSNSSSKVLELIRPWREDVWREYGQPFLKINQRKFELLRPWVIIAGENCSLSAPASASREFYAAMKRASSLLEDCSDDQWLLKAVELWECKEHFAEVLLDLCWSVHIMNLRVGKLKQSIDWMDSVAEMFSEQHCLGRSDLDKVNEIDKLHVEFMVEMKLADKTLKVDGPEHQLAHLLQDRFKNQNLWGPPFLRRNSYFVYRFASQRLFRRGGKGVVVKFLWVYGKEFAMKTRHPKEELPMILKREYDILDKYRSPYIVGVVGYWEAESRSSWNPFTPTVRSPFLLMESLEFDLEDLIHICKRERIRTGFSALETICLMLPVAKALRFLHGKDVVHRDVKPRDIMCKNVNLRKYHEAFIVKEDTIVKLIDFGEARENVSCIADDQWGRAGTPGYMDPTMWKEDVVGYTLFMGDVFSFAMVFSELLTWRSLPEAFGARGAWDAQAKLKAGERPSLPSDLPGYLRFIVESCWHVDHLKRPDFKAICSMLQHAKFLLLDEDFNYEPDDLFSYEDATGWFCCISDGT